MHKLKKGSLVRMLLAGDIRGFAPIEHPAASTELSTKKGPQKGAKKGPSLKHHVL